MPLFFPGGVPYPFGEGAQDAHAITFLRGETMAGAAEVQVSHFLDEHGLGSFQIRLLVWSVLIALIDGYDIGAIAFAAPHLIQEWHILAEGARPCAERQQYRRAVRLADFRLGRRPLRPQDRAHLCNFLFGVFTFAAAYSTDLSQLSWLRFVAGLGIGGVIPNMVAINAESAPRNLRATLAIIAAGLVPLGGAMAGFASAASCRSYGWQILFHIGGIVPIVIALAAIMGLPESIKFMALHENQRPKMEALLHDDPPRLQGAAQRALRHRGRKAIAEFQSDPSLQQRAVARSRR